MISAYRFPLAWASLIFLLSAIPVVETPSLSWLEPDKLVHVIFYTILTLLICRAVNRHNKLLEPGKVLFISLIISILYGGLIEFIQEELLPWRSGDMYDFLADVVGALLGSLIFIYFYRKSKKKEYGFKEESQS